MEIDAEKLKAFIETTIKHFKTLEQSLLAYQGAFLAMKMSDPAQYEKWNYAYQALLQSPSFQEQLQKYDSALEALSRQFSEDPQGQDPLRWFLDLKLEGPKN